ncbi:MFS transporter [Antrihabitans spumae]|uniref:MFS transporter n=1 Tax=Antrihabitans spumae TaxID=3373370 RepID=A0ABW7JR97_9NOCA
MSRLRTLALYAGGFLGPFGGGVVTAMLPEMGNDLGVSSPAAASTLAAYLFPFAILMLVSGTLGARWGQFRTVRIAYAVYVVASLACVVAPSLSFLLVPRAIQGCANAFTTPLLLASLASITPKARLGRALGTFSALQAAGQTTAPLVGGLAAEVNWRLAFVAVAVVAAILGIVGLPTGAQVSGREVKLRQALRPDVVRIGLVAFLGWGALGGLNFLVAFRAEDAFGLGPTQRGLLLTGFGIAGIIAARPVGNAIDRIGARRSVLIGATCGAVLVTLAGTAGLLVVAAAAWAAAGVAGQGILVGVNAAVLGLRGPNQGGALSVVQSLRFSGQALAPVLLTPLYGVHPTTAFVIPAVLLALVAPVLMPRPRAETEPV